MSQIQPPTLRVAFAASLALAVTTAAAGRNPVDLPIDPVLPPRETATALAGHPFAAPILEDMVLGIGSHEIDIVLGEATATSGDCLGVKLVGGRLNIALGGASFTIGASKIGIEIAVDRFELSGIDIKTKSALSACNWTGTFGVGVTASDVRVVLELAPRVRFDDCFLVTLGSFNARVSIGDVNVKNVQNDIDDIFEEAVEDSVNAVLSVVSTDFFAELLQDSMLRTLCESKLALYKAYMAAMFGGVETYPLAEEVTRRLAAYYPTVDLKSVRIGYRWQPASNNTTDCSQIYFSDPDLVQRLRHGLELDGAEWNLVFHELQHTEQCARLGGRDAFAKRWFRDLEYAVLLSNFTDPLGYVMELHDNMPMEEDAADRADEIVVVQGTVREAATLAPVEGMEVTAFLDGSVGAGAVGPEASDITSTASPPRRVGGRFSLFLEPGAHDLYLGEPGRGGLGGVGRDRRALAIDGLTLARGDQLVEVTIAVDANGLPLPPPASAPQFVRGDADTSGEINISDVLFTLGYLFTNGGAPACLKAADTNDDGRVDISDPLAILGFLFLGSSAPAAPFPAPGSDPTADSLTCEMGA